jgi:prepilin-type N-terminal cleavage/methylation domain-containing protein
MKIKSRYESGFTLIEIAIVLLIVTILLGYTVALFPVQQELKQYRQVEEEIKEIIGQLIGFAQINGRLPCPDTSGDINETGISGVIDGQADTDDLIINATGAPAPSTDDVIDNCKAFFGFLPSATLGMNGDINVDGQLQDPWGEPYRYHISNVTTAGFPAIDLVSPNGIREEGLIAVTPDLNVCTTSLNASATNLICGEPGVEGKNVVTGVAVVIISTGKDRNTKLLVADNSPIQIENLDGFHNGTIDKVYTASTRSDVNNTEYDDVVKWISTNQLFTKMIEADQLP